MARILTRLRLLIQRIRPRVISALKFIKLLRVEPYIFFYAFQLGLVSSPNQQLYQDKICTRWYDPVNKTAYCHDLPSIDEDDSIGTHYKTRILADATQFGTYTSYATILPSVIWALFIGAWVDRYIKARKLLMIMSVSSGIIENLISIYLSLKWDTSVYYNLLIHIPKSMAGGGSAARIAITHYITSTTPPSLMATRFLIFEIIFSLALPIGQSLGGYVLVQKPTFHNGEIRNFTMCFIVALVFEVIALLWIVFMINEKVARNQEIKIEMKIRRIKGEGEINLEPDMNKQDKDIHPLKLLFDLGNVKDMIKTVLKKRPNKARRQLILLVLSLAFYVGELVGVANVDYQFIQRAYLWSPDTTAYMYSISSVMSSVSSMTIIPLLSKVFKMPDVKLALLGFCTICGCNILYGTWLSPYAFYIDAFVGVVVGAASVGPRSLIAKLVDRNEMGKIMSFMSTLETIGPVVANTVFSYVFEYTIDSYPGAIYQGIAAVFLFPIISMMWIDLYTKPPLEDNCHKDRNENIVNHDENIILANSELGDQRRHYNEEDVYNSRTGSEPFTIETYERHFV